MDQNGKPPPWYNKVDRTKPLRSNTSTAPGTGKGKSKAAFENEFQPGKDAQVFRPMRDEATDSSRILLAQW